LGQAAAAFFVGESLLCYRVNTPNMKVDDKTLDALIRRLHTIEDVAENEDDQQQMKFFSQLRESIQSLRSERNNLARQLDDLLDARARKKRIWDNVGMVVAYGLASAIVIYIVSVCIPLLIIIFEWIADIFS
jgi:hypothetical protein